MAGNNSIQILRGSQNYDLKVGTDVLMDGQPFYSKKTTELFVGDGQTPISGLKPVKALTDQTYNSDSDVAQSGKAVAEAITPLTDEQVDALWTDVSGITNVPTIRKEVIDFTYYNEKTLTANSKHTIKSSGYYMCYCDNAKLKVCKADGTVVVEGAKQIQMMTAPGYESSSSNFKACGQYWTGSTSILSLPIEGFRTTLTSGSYVTADEEFAICQMVKGV